MMELRTNALRMRVTNPRTLKIRGSRLQLVKPVGSEQSMPANGNLRSKGKARARIPSPEPALSDEDIEHACNDDTHQLSRKSFLSTNLAKIKCME